MNYEMAKKCETASSGAVTSTTEDERVVIRERKREKQLRYQRHKARLSSLHCPDEPSSVVAITSSRDASPARANTSDCPSVSSPPTQKTLSLSHKNTPKMSTKNTVKGEKTNEETMRKESPERLSNFPKRHPMDPTGTVIPRSRKSDLVEQMLAKKKMLLSMSPNTQPTLNKPESHLDEVEEKTISLQSEQGTQQDTMPQLLDVNEKISTFGTVTTVESEFPMDEILSTLSNEARANNARCRTSSTTPFLNALEAAPNKQTVDPANAENQKEGVYQDTDGTAMVKIAQHESHSPNKAFDMRSILEHPLTSPEARNNTDDERYLANLDCSTDVAVFNPMDDEFVQRLSRIEESQQEEKKEKEVNDDGRHAQSVDATWDTTQVVFEQKSRSTPTEENATKSDVIDMFDTTSLGEASSTFFEVESHFTRLVQETRSSPLTSNSTNEQKPTLEDLGLCSHPDGSFAIVNDTNVHVRYTNTRLLPGQMLETPKEDEPLLFGTFPERDHFIEIKDEYPSMDESSLIGILSKSEEDTTSACRMKKTGDGTRQVTSDELSSRLNSSRSDCVAIEKVDNTQPTEVCNEEQPLLSGAFSSDENVQDLDEQQVPVEERVEMYNAPKELDEESSTSTNTDGGYSEKDDGDSVNYDEHESEDEDMTVDILNPLSIQVADGMRQDVPTFDKAAVAAIQPNFDMSNGMGTSPEEQLQGHVGLTSMSAHKDDLGYGRKGAIAVENRETEENKKYLAMLPPPPPPPGTKKKKRKNARRVDGKIALLPPPPAGKLKEWEAEKMRGHLHLVAMKSHPKQLDTLNIEPPPTTTREPFPSLFPSSPAKKAKSASEKARSPSNMENVVDRITAEKLIFASSAAAQSFEQRILSDPLSRDWISNESNERHAFQNWGEADVGCLGNQRQPLSQSCFTFRDETEDNIDDKVLLTFLSREVLGNTDVQVEEQSNVPLVIRILLEDDHNFNTMCRHLAECVNNVTSSGAEEFDGLTLTTTLTEDESVTTTDYTLSSTKSKQSIEKQRPLLQPMILSQDTQRLSSGLLAANFVSFLYLASKLANIPSPFGKSNPFLSDIVNTSLQTTDSGSRLGREKKSSSPQQVIFSNSMGNAEKIVEFVYRVCRKSTQNESKIKDALKIDTISEEPKLSLSGPTTPCAGNTMATKGLRFVVPDLHPSPFETALWAAPRFVPAVLSFLGDPVAVCRMKMVNRFCRRLVSENEHMLMQHAVRIGGISMNVRPAFWMWITLQKCPQEISSQARLVTTPEELRQREQAGKDGKWHHVIQRDVERSFGNMPPHKTGARLRTDSIVRALVTWGKNRIMRRGVKGGGEESPLPELGPSKKLKDKPLRSSASPPPWECSPGRTSDSDSNEIPTNTVSDWGGVSPVASMAESSNAGFIDEAQEQHNFLPREELALSGNCLSAEMKSNLQSKLSFILNTLAASHVDVGYCQGMDYVVAHLLRILQDTIRWNAVQNTLPPCIVSSSTLPDLSTLNNEPLPKIYDEVDKSVIVEEVVFRVMDTFFTTYNLRHMYWPELRCLKTCCRVFERLIQIKLPVLADHFEHHDLNVGLFALGWFQTLFLYLPSMPSATVCHMWDIWLVERSFKIFFRVGTAILFLSQPILLNHELEGMMTYLNTIPDATLLKPDILIACALNIKVTNRMLQELETEVTSCGA